MKNLNLVKSAVIALVSGASLKTVFCQLVDGHIFVYKSIKEHEIFISMDADEAINAFIRPVDPSELSKKEFIKLLQSENLSIN